MKQGIIYSSSWITRSTGSRRFKPQHIIRPRAAFVFASGKPQINNSEVFGRSSQPQSQLVQDYDTIGISTSTSRNQAPERHSSSPGLGVLYVRAACRRCYLLGSRPHKLPITHLLGIFFRVSRNSRSLVGLILSFFSLEYHAASKELKRGEPSAYMSPIHCL